MRKRALPIPTPVAKFRSTGISAISLRHLSILKRMHPLAHPKNRSEDEPAFLMRNCHLWKGFFIAATSGMPQFGPKCFRITRSS